MVSEFGCEYANALNAITSYFSGVSLGQFGDKVDYYGIDNDAQSIAFATRRASRAYAPILQNIHFLLEDVTKLSSNPQAPQQSDVVIVRHPYSRQGSFGGEPILRAGFDNLSAGGIMVVTTYDQSEIDAVNNLFGAQVGFTSQTNAPASVYVDRHISVVMK